MDYLQKEFLLQILFIQYFVENLLEN